MFRVCTLDVATVVFIRVVVGRREPAIETEIDRVFSARQVDLDAFAAEHAGVPCRFTRASSSCQVAVHMSKDE